MPLHIVEIHRIDDALGEFQATQPFIDAFVDIPIVIQCGHPADAAHEPDLLHRRCPAILQAAVWKSVNGISPRGCRFTTTAPVPGRVARPRVPALPETSGASFFAAPPLPAANVCAILNHMVQYMTVRLDTSFAALSDATRRGVLEQLGRADASITDLAEKFHMTLTGMKKHVGVLEQAGLVTTKKIGRVRTGQLGPRRLGVETAWLERYRQRWVES